MASPSRTASEAPSAMLDLPPLEADGSPNDMEVDGAQQGTPAAARAAALSAGASMQRTMSRATSGGGASSAGRSFGAVAPSGTPGLRFRGELGYGMGTTPGRAQPRSRLEGIDGAEPSSDIAPSDAYDDQKTFIWGTNLVVDKIERSFRRFVLQFKEPGEMRPKYLQLLRQAQEYSDIAFNINCADLASFDITLYHQVVDYPKDVIPLLDAVLKDILQHECDQLPESANATSIMVRPFNLQYQRNIRELDPTDIDKLVSVSGMVTRTSNILPEMRAALYECENCKGCEYAINMRGQITEFDKCPHCQSVFSMRIVHNRCIFDNKQLVKLQESPNEVPEGETPQALNLFAFEDMTDWCKPGDRITVTGVYRAAPIRSAPRANRRELKAIFKTHIDIVHIKREERGRMFSLYTDFQATQLGETQPVSQQEAVGSQAEQDGPVENVMKMDNLLNEQVQAKEEELQELARDPEIYEKLVRSLAPSIWQMDDVKRGVLCQLFGGVSKTHSTGRTRGDIHVLLIGDPGVSKSQLLTYVHKLAARGIYTSGRGSSAVGLTAYVSKDPETKDMVLESGALVLSDQGVCCIDEFDKMTEGARSMLHEVMEQQTVSVAKAGIIATLNARTSVLASANPLQSRYNPRLSVIENIQLPPTLLSRFDLIYLVLDKADEARDRHLAKHLVMLHGTNANASQKPPIPLETLRDYIAYARMKCKPVLTDAAMKELVEGYLDMRRMGSSKNVISATARQLESLLRLSEALARMKLAPSVEAEDVKEAIRLMRVATMASATDAATGLIDMEALTTGVTLGQRQARAQLAEEIKNLLQSRNGDMTVLELVTMLQGQSSVRVAEKDVKAALTSLSDAVNWNRDTGRVIMV